MINTCSQTTHGSWSSVCCMDVVGCGEGVPLLPDSFAFFFAEYWNKISKKSLNTKGETSHGDLGQRRLSSTKKDHHWALFSCFLRSQRTKTTSLTFSFATAYLCVSLRKAFASLRARGETAEQRMFWSRNTKKPRAYTCIDMAWQLRPVTTKCAI